MNGKIYKSGSHRRKELLFLPRQRRGDFHNRIQRNKPQFFICTVKPYAEHNAYFFLCQHRLIVRQIRGRGKTCILLELTEPFYYAALVEIARCGDNRHSFQIFGSHAFFLAKRRVVRHIHAPLLLDRHIDKIIFAYINRL